MFLMGGLFGASMLRVLAALAYKVFLCIAVYKDAIEHSDRNTALWTTVLTAIFGFIPAVVYAIFRYQKEKDFVTCRHCGKMVSKKYPVCMFCKQPTGDESGRSLISEEVKKYLILAGVFFIVQFVFEGIIAASGARQAITFNLF